MIAGLWALIMVVNCSFYVSNCLFALVDVCVEGGLRLRLTVKVPSMDIILLRLVSTSNGTPYWRSGIKAAWSLVACLWKQVRFKDHTDPSSYSSDMCCNLVSPPPSPRQPQPQPRHPCPSSIPPQPYPTLTAHRKEVTETATITWVKRVTAAHRSKAPPDTSVRTQAGFLQSIGLSSALGLGL